MAECLRENPEYNIFRDEIHSVILFHTVKILDSYSLDKGKFYSYWQKGALRQIYRCINKFKAQISREYSYLSLDSSNVNNRLLHDVFGAEDMTMKRQLLVESFVSIANDPNNSFSCKERHVLKLYLEGYSYKEIAALTNQSISNVYKLYHSAVKKIGDVLVPKKK